MNRPNLPAAWIEGRERCVPDRQAYLPCSQAPTLEVIRQWFEGGVAKNLALGPVPSLGDSQFGVQCEVLCFDTHGADVWRTCSGVTFRSKSYEEAKQVLQHSGLVELLSSSADPSIAN